MPPYFTPENREQISIKSGMGMGALILDEQIKINFREYS
jgi:hypothetical protein